jgi:hypothetical protein
VTEIGGSLFLFDCKILRYFRMDGHNWRKKKDGKTVKEAHEKLKVSKEFSTENPSLSSRLAEATTSQMNFDFDFDDEVNPFLACSVWMP